MVTFMLDMISFCCVAEAGRSRCVELEARPYYGKLFRNLVSISTFRNTWQHFSQANQRLKKVMYITLQICKSAPYLRHRKEFPSFVLLSPFNSGDIPFSSLTKTA